MSRVRAGDIELEVCDEGRGSPLLLVHGFPLNHAMWESQIAEFKSRYRLLAPDLRGHGASAVTAGTVTMEQYADDLAALLDSLGETRPVTLCGLSMGGYIAWQFWRRHRSRLKALVLCDTRAAADKPEAARGRLDTAKTVLEAGPQKLVDTMLPKLFADATQRTRPDRVEATRRVMLASPREGIAAALRGMAARPDMTPELPKVDIPTLAICGVHDLITPATEMRDMAAKMPRARYVEIEDAGHMAPLEQPEAVNNAINSFLEQLP